MNLKSGIKVLFDCNVLAYNIILLVI